MLDVTSGVVTWTRDNEKIREHSQGLLKGDGSVHLEGKGWRLAQPARWWSTTADLVLKARAVVGTAEATSASGHTHRSCNVSLRETGAGSGVLAGAPVPTAPQNANSPPSIPLLSETTAVPATAAKTPKSEPHTVIASESAEARTSFHNQTPIASQLPVPRPTSTQATLSNNSTTSPVQVHSPLNPKPQTAHEKDEPIKEDTTKGPKLLLPPNLLDPTPHHQTDNLEAVLFAFALPSDASYSANDWSSIQSNRFLWQDKGPVLSSSGGFKRSGTLKLKDLGEAKVTFSGARTMVNAVEVNVNQAEGKVLTPSQFDSVLKAQLSGNTGLRKIRGKCNDEGTISGSSVYNLSIPGKKPFYLLVSSDVGGNVPNSGSVSFDASLQKESRWDCGVTAGAQAASSSQVVSRESSVETDSVASPKTRFLPEKTDDSIRIIELALAILVGASAATFSLLWFRRDGTRSKKPTQVDPDSLMRQTNSVQSPIEINAAAPWSTSDRITTANGLGPTNDARDFNNDQERDTVTPSEITPDVKFEKVSRDARHANTDASIGLKAVEQTGESWPSPSSTPTESVEPTYVLGTTGFSLYLSCLLALPIIASIFTWIMALQGWFEVNVYFFLVVGLINTVSTAFVASADAKKIGMTRDKDKGGYDPSAWFFMMIIVWVICYPAYFFKRDAFSRGNTFGLGLLATVLFLSSLFFAPNVAANHAPPPQCDAPEVISTANGLIANAPVAKILGIENVGITLPAEINYDSKQQKRTCRANLTSSLGQESVRYTVEWHDRVKNLIWISILR